MEDIELTPKNYEHPIRPRNVDVYTTVGKRLFQEIHAFFEVVKIETDLDWFGFDEFEKIKTETFLKYDETKVMSNIIENNIYETGETFCDLTIKLSENVRTQRRVYTKFVTILGDIGGFMEVIFTLFRIMCAMSVDILYEVSMVNNLFKFDLEKKNISLKFGDDETILKTKNNNDNNIKHNDKTIMILKPKKLENIGRTRTITLKQKTSSRFLKDYSSSNNSNSKVRPNLNDIYINEERKNNENTNNINNNINLIFLRKANLEKVRLNRACIYLWFCFVRRRQILPNALLNEGMDIISKRLDAFNIFKRMYIAEQQKQIIIDKIIPMSNECNNRIQLILNNILKI